MFLLPGILAVVGGVLFLLGSPTSHSWEESALSLLALAALYLVLGATCIHVALRLARFGTALSPRGRELRPSDLTRVARTHLGVWQAMILMTVLLLAILGLFFFTLPLETG